MRPALRSALLLGAVLAGACSESDPSRSVAPSDILTLTASPAAVPADGVSRVTLTARIPANAATANRAITFRAAEGTLIGGSAGSLTVTADLEGQATAQLQSGTRALTVRVEAQVQSFLQAVNVAFTAAAPDRIEVDAGTFELMAGASHTTTLTATLRRGTGFATEGTPVDFAATTPNGSRLGELRSVTPSSAAGQATALFTAGATDFRGTATITARVRDAAGQTVQGSTTLAIIDDPNAPAGT